MFKTRLYHSFKRANDARLSVLSVEAAFSGFLSS